MTVRNSWHALYFVDRTNVAKFEVLLRGCSLQARLMACSQEVDPSSLTRRIGECCCVGAPSSMRWRKRCEMRHSSCTWTVMTLVCRVVLVLIIGVKRLRKVNTPTRSIVSRHSSFRCPGLLLLMPAFDC